MAAHPSALRSLATYAMSLTGKTARTQLGRRLSQIDVSLTEFAILASVNDSPSGSQRSVAAAVRADPADLTRSLDALQARSLIRRERDPADRRRQMTTLTPSGRELLADCLEIAQAVQNEVLHPLSSAERIALHSMLVRVLDEL